MFNDNDRVIVLSGSPPKSDTKYKITKVSLQHKIVIQQNLAKHITLEYDRVIRDRHIPLYNSDTKWSWSFSMPCKSLKGIIVQSRTVVHRRHGQVFATQRCKRSLSLLKLSLISNTLKECDRLKNNMRFASISLRDNDANEVQKHLQLNGMDVGDYLTMSMPYGLTSGRSMKTSYMGW